ncbi:P-loop NTPase fold protein [uncultured Dokdonia sp.]|uniref:P-loop NTPase fold protein n=1 Tax=uncultured Dokdonia sp. TaxID=575653 RepID=UPI0030ED4513|tara:strand:- start:13558 stop:16782 length:3225 start_codon:yes stop_codon:yes gene_type:complete
MRRSSLENSVNVDLILQILNYEFEAGLSKSENREKANNLQYFDFVNQETRVAVEINVVYNSNNRDNFLNKIKSIRNSLRRNFQQKYRFIFVVLADLEDKDREFLQRGLNSNNEVDQIVLDLKDLKRLANKYGLFDNFFTSSESSTKDSSSITNINPNPKKNKKNLSEFRDKKFFIAGHIWNGNDQIDRFFTDGIWKNSQETNDKMAINNVLVGDLIFIKSTYSQLGNIMLRIKAVGIVTGNLLDGHTLLVRWTILNNHVHIPNLGKYNKNFQRVTLKDRNTVMIEVLKEYPNLLESISNQSVERGSIGNLGNGDPKLENVTKSVTQIAGLISDADSGADYLDIKKDVNAFAKVMSAKSFNPPLAIALLGKWGSGKSFFMRKLKERIQILSESDTTQNAYCGGIAHVHFNAWSYMDSNLWAGIITKIFEGLQEYITNDSLASKKREDIEKVLIKKMTISKDEIVELDHQKESIDKKIKALQSQKGKAEEQLEKRINKIRSKSIKTALNKLDESFKITEKVSNTLVENDSFNKSKKQFSEIIPEAYWQDPKELYKKIKSKYTFLKTFFKGANWKNSLLWFIGIVFFIFSMKTIVVFLVHMAGKVDFTFPDKIWYYTTIVGTVVYRTYKTSKHIKPLVVSFWKIKEDYEIEKKEVIFKINQAEKALKFEIQNHKTEIDAINTQITQAKQTKLEIEYRLENTLTTEALFNFIEKRSNSDDYKKHLGIVSVIRKDFEILSDLFNGHQDELNNFKKSKESEEFKKYFSKPLERIILYVDDLDRCSDDRVVQVLEAVNLLMAYPLFVVVVGVDPRWVKSALKKKYKLQFSNNNDSDESESIEPSGYLEKIFQVPFQLKAASNKSVKHMLKTLAETKPVLVGNEYNLNYKDDQDISEDSQEDLEVIDIDFSKEGEVQPKPIVTETIESIKFTDKEIELLQNMSDILGTNPRALKRFVNIYRVIKAHENFDYSNESEDGELLAVMFLIALPLGKYRKLSNSFEEYIKISLDENKDLSSFEIEGYNEYIMKRAIDPSVKKNQLVDLNTKMINKLRITSPSLLSQKKIVFRKHNEFIKRFTFNNL